MTMSSAMKWSVIEIGFALVASAGCCEHTAGYDARFQLVDAGTQVPVASTSADSSDDDESGIDSFLKFPR